MAPALLRAAQLMLAVETDLTARYQYYAHLAGMLLDVRVHRVLGRVFRRPELRALAKARPELPRKYLWRCLARGLGRRERLVVMLAHYRCLSERLMPEVANSLVQRPEPLWERVVDADLFTVSLAHARRLLDYEGELTLVFEMNGVPLYTLWFTIADGAVFGQRSPHVIFVGGVQGTIGRLDLMKEVARQCDDLAPRTILLATIAGVASAFGIDAIIAVGNESHVSRHVTPPEKFRFDYDAFWREMGAAPERGYFVLSVPPREKPLDQIAATHRRRAVQRRAGRESVTTAVAARVGELLRRG